MQKKKEAQEQRNPNIPYYVDKKYGLEKKISRERDNSVNSNRSRNNSISKNYSNKSIEADNYNLRRNADNNIQNRYMKPINAVSNAGKVLSREKSI